MGTALRSQRRLAISQRRKKPWFKSFQTFKLFQALKETVWDELSPSTYLRGDSRETYRSKVLGLAQCASTILCFQRFERLERLEHWNVEPFK
jgi:hypothetical protein